MRAAYWRCQGTLSSFLIRHVAQVQQSQQVYTSVVAQTCNDAHR